MDAPGVLGNDADLDGDSLKPVLPDSSALIKGDVALNPNGSFSYTPEPGFTGTEWFTYQASDGSLKSSPLKVTITVNG